MAACGRLGGILLLCWICTSLVVVQSARDDIINPVPPSLGDIALLPWKDRDNATTGRVAIFFTDGVNQSRWGTVCAEPTSLGLAAVVCHQLGFSSGQYYTAGNANFPENYETWIRNVKCGEGEDHPQNLLRCTYDLYKGDSEHCGHDMDLVVECSGHKVPEQPYEGQVWLCPPDGADAGPLHQISMGLVLIFLHNEWGAINERNIETSLRTYRANSICRQLGYSQAVPDSTLTVKGASARYTYDTCQSGFGKKSWFVAEEIDGCSSSGERCFGCCYDYPTEPYGCNCSKLLDITLTCMYDPYNDAKPESGNEDMCRFNSKSRIDNAKQVCGTGSASKLEIEIFSPIVAALLLVVVALAIAVAGLASIVWRRRLYQPLRYVQDPPENAEPAGAPAGAPRGP